jgi:hypothetical protein
LRLSLMKLLKLGIEGLESIFHHCSWNSTGTAISSHCTATAWCTTLNRETLQDLHVKDKLFSMTSYWIRLKKKKITRNHIVEYNFG